MKIVYCTDSICYAGGIQRITVVKANAMADIEGNEVYIIVTDNKKRPVFPVSPKVHLIDLGVNYFEDDWKGKLQILKGIMIKRVKHKKMLKRALKEIRPDIVISTGTSEKNFLPCLSLKHKPIFIREIHCSKNYRHLAAVNVFEKLLAYAGDFFDYKLNINKYDNIVLLTNEDKNKNWPNNNRVVVVPNPITKSSGITSELSNKRMIAVGRLVPQKNFKSLVNAWALVEKKHPDWILEIWGDGGLKKVLESQIKDMGLTSKILMRGYTYDINKQYLNSSAFVLSSKFEGFPLVMVEAMSCGLPVVSYACHTGPKDIITEGKDGFLVPVNDEVTLADRICYLIENYDRRKEMGKAAKEKSTQYAVEIIAQCWMNLFTNLLKDRKC